MRKRGIVVLAVLTVLAAVGVTAYVLIDADKPLLDAAVFPRVEFRPLVGQPVPAESTCSARYTAPDQQAVAAGMADGTAYCYTLQPAGLVPHDLDATAEVQSVNGTGTWSVLLRLGTNDARTFAALTEQTKNRFLAIVLVEGSTESPRARVLSAPTVQDTITNGEVAISGNFNEKDARDLAAALSH